MKLLRTFVLILSLFVIGCDNEYDEILAKKTQLEQNLSDAFESNKISEAVSILTLLAKVDYIHKWDLAMFYLRNEEYQNIDKSIQLLEELSRDQYIPAKEFLGSMYYYGTYVERDYEAAFTWYMNVLDYSHNPRVLIRIGTMFATGKGVKKNKRIAFQYLSESSKQGYVPAYLLMRMVRYNMNSEEK